MQTMIAVILVLFFVDKISALLLSDLQTGNTILIKNFYGGYLYNKLSNDYVIETSDDLSLSDANFFWNVIKHNGNYRFQNEATGKYIKGHDNGVVYGSEKSTGGSWLSWYSGTIGDGIQKIKRESGGKCMKSEQIIDPSVVIGSCSTDDKYYFSFQYKPLYLSNLKVSDTVVISNAYDYLFYSDNTDPKKIITTNNYNINDGHLWYIEQPADTYYRFKNKLTGYYIKGVQDEVDLVGYTFDVEPDWNQQKRIRWYQGANSASVLYKTKIKRQYKGHCWKVASVNDQIELEGSCNTGNSFYFSFGLYDRPITPSPSNSPTPKPTSTPTKYPTLNPSNNPSVSPTQYPTNYPTSIPTSSPSKNPTISPTDIPTKVPTDVPTKNPSILPTIAPTKNPSITPTTTPTSAPSAFNLNQCQTARGCKRREIFCPDNQDCEIICSGEEACATALIHCPNNGQCIFSCFGFKACYGTRFVAGTTGSDMIFQSTGGWFLSDGFIAEVATIDARNADSLLFNGVCWSIHNTCKQMKIYCPLTSNSNNDKCQLYRNTRDLRYAVLFVPNDLSDIHWRGAYPFTVDQGVAVNCNHDGDNYNSYCEGIHSTSEQYLLCNSGDSICGTPTPQPTLEIPTPNPTNMPTFNTQNPTTNPSVGPTLNPSNNPSVSPTKQPSASPTKSPTKSPTINPTQNPTLPTSHPTVTTLAPTKNPTFDLNSCRTARGCKNMEIFCPDNQDCEIVCSGEEACATAQIHCPNNGICTFSCLGFKACYGTQFIAGTTGSDMIFQSTGGWFTSDGFSAEVATIDARNADSLYFNGVCWSHYNTCKHMKIYCPLTSNSDNDKCHLYRKIYDLRYAVLFVPNDLSDIHWRGSYPNSYPFTEDQGVAVHCNYDGNDYNSFCEGIHSTEDKYLLCGDSICNAPTQNPTNNPSVSPIKSPTINPTKPPTFQ